MAKTYFTLATLEDGKWCPQFGTYDHQEALDEKADTAQRSRIIRHTIGPDDLDDGSLAARLAILNA